MVDYISSIKRPFSDLNKLLMAIVLSIIPIVNFIFLGWLLDIIRSTTKKDVKLPDFNNFGQMFVQGLLTLVICFVYSLPVVILMIVLKKTGVFSLSALSGGLFTSNLMGAGYGIMAAIMNILTSLGMYLVVIAAVALIFGLLGSVAILSYAQTRKFESAFDFSKITKVSFNGHFFWNWILTVLVFGGALSAVMASVPGVGLLIVAAVVGIAAFTNLAQAYSEVRA